MKRICLILVTVILFLATADAQSKITLKEFEDSSKQGYESIFFEYDTLISGQSQKVTKVFDIEANNPFNSYNDNIEEVAKTGGKIYRVEKPSDLIDDLNISEETLREGMLASSHWFFAENEGYAAIAYNLFLHGKYGGVSTKRFAEVMVLNYRGDVIAHLEDLDFDVYGVTVSSNGKYLFYAYGEQIGDSEEVSQGGFRINNLESKEVFYEQRVWRVDGFFRNENEMSISTAESDDRYLYIFDELSSRLYKIQRNRVGIYLGYMLNTSMSGDTLDISDYQRVR